MVRIHRSMVRMPRSVVRIRGSVVRMPGSVERIHRSVVRMPGHMHPEHPFREVQRSHLVELGETKQILKCFSHFFTYLLSTMTFISLLESGRVSQLS